MKLNNIEETQLFSAFEGLEIAARKELSNSVETLNVTLIGLSIEKYSNQFWNFSEHTRKYQIEISGRSSGWLLTAYVDVQGTYLGATWGTIAGPTGSVIMGANGAMLYS